MPDAYVLVKLVHILLATTWVGAMVFDWAFNLQRFRRLGGAQGLRGYVEEASPTVPFWAIVGLGTLIVGFETARRLFGSWNPFDWPDVSTGGGYILASLWLVIASIILGIAQVPPKATAVADSGDDAASTSMLQRIHWLGAVELVLILAVVVLMVGAGMGGY